MSNLGSPHEFDHIGDSVNMIPESKFEGDDAAEEKKPRSRAAEAMAKAGGSRQNLMKIGLVVLLLAGFGFAYMKGMLAPLGLKAPFAAPPAPAPVNIQPLPPLAAPGSGGPTDPASIPKPVPTGNNVPVFADPAPSAPVASTPNATPAPTPAPAPVPAPVVAQAPVAVVTAPVPVAAPAPAPAPIPVPVVSVAQPQPSPAPMAAPGPTPMASTTPVIVADPAAMAAGKGSKPPKPVAVPPKAPEEPKVDPLLAQAYSLRMIVGSEAWMTGPEGEVVSVTVGDTLPGLGRVTSLDKSKLLVKVGEFVIH